jgi:hypothetical protein
MAEYPYTAPHFAPLGHVAVLSARMEQLAGLMLGLLLDLEDARTGYVMSGPLSMSQILERTTAMAVLRLEDTRAVDRWVKEASAAAGQRNRLLHSAWRPMFDHETQEESLHRQRLQRSGEWDVNPDMTIDAILSVAVALMSANAAGTNAYIVTERMLLGRTDLL